MVGVQKWQIGNTLCEDGTQREYITHLVTPRFTARIVKVDPFENQPVVAEGEADMTTGHIYSMSREAILCEVLWVDEVSDGCHQEWLAEAAYVRDRFSGYFMRWASLYPVVDMTRRIDLDISKCQTWSDYRKAFCEEDDRTDGYLAERVKKLADVVSPGEVPVLLCMLHAANYSRFADEVISGDSWHFLEKTHGPHAEAVALAIMQQ